VVQFLANRGYAVLQPNFRGSTGYGKAFVAAGNREWGRQMQDDLTDGVNWLVAQDVADPRRVAIMGGSYGGYAVLAGITFTPSLYAAGVDLFGPSDLPDLLRTAPAYWAPTTALRNLRIGDPDLDEPFLRSRSPAFFADRATAPVLIGQGDNDPRVRPAQSDQMVAALRAAGKPVDYYVYAREGHGFGNAANSRHFYAQTEALLARTLGGRAEPVGAVPGNTASKR
jgi:dipeptidyl aminopeptidase/acylaminoacyl peptidase